MEQLLYTPNDGFIGEDTFTYTICDDANPALCDTATVTVTVQPTDAPNTTNANDDAYSINILELMYRKRISK